MRHARHKLPIRLTRVCIDVSDAQPSYSVCTIATIRVRFATDLGLLLLPLHTFRQDGSAYVYLADVFTIRAIGLPRSRAQSATWLCRHYC
jgi:hypothetical protein